MSPQSNSPQKQKSPEEQERILRSAYFSIIDGFSLGQIEQERIFIKHFDLKTQTEIDNYYKSVFNKAREKGLLTHEETLASLIKNGSWSEKEEETLQKREKGVAKLEANLSKALDDTMKKSMESALKHSKKLYESIRDKKNKLITNTCEEFAERRSSDLIVKLSFYKDDKITPFFSENEFDLLDRQDLAQLINIYNNSVADLSATNIQNIALADFFTSYFNLVESNVSSFFNKPMHELTFFQINLLNYAQIFNSIFKNLDPPDHLKDNPEGLLKFAKQESDKRKKEATKNKARIR